MQYFIPHPLDGVLEALVDLVQREKAAVVGAPAAADGPGQEEGGVEEAGDGEGERSLDLDVGGGG